MKPSDNLGGYVVWPLFPLQGRQEGLGDVAQMDAQYLCLLEHSVSLTANMS